MALCYGCFEGTYASLFILLSTLVDSPVFAWIVDRFHNHMAKTYCMKAVRELPNDCRPINTNHKPIVNSAVHLSEVGK